MGPKLELREFYYTLRQTPDLIRYFADLKPETIYGAVLDSINVTEILADYDRDLFTMGNLSKGFIFDAHSVSFYDKDRKVGFTESISRTLEDYQLETTQNIIVVEKNAAATRLVELGISELTNSCIVTVGGNFSRAIWSLTERFKDKKNLLFICDGDVYGDDMMRTIEFGTMNSRHLPYKFPKVKFANIHLTGLFPSVGEKLGLPNDVEQKRPLNNPYAKKRLEFLERYNLVDERDIDAWRRNNTYELEALSTTFRNTKDEPVGLGIYLIEYMRLNDIPIKPPLPSDEELKKKFDQAAKDEFWSEIEAEVITQSPKQDLLTTMEQLIDNKSREIITEIYDEHEEELKDCLEQVGPKEIKFHINKQFSDNPSRSGYDLRAIAHKLKTTFNIDVNWNADDIKKLIEDALVKYIDDLSEAGKLWDSDIEFTPIHNETKTEDVYDMALKAIGADPKDAEKIREALQWRLDNEPGTKQG